MGIRINSNPTALITLRNLALANSNVARSSERLSSGYRINRASDDPSGMVIAESLRAESSGLNQAVDNAQLTQSLISTVDGVLSQISTQLSNIETDILAALSTPSNTATLQLQLDTTLDSIDNLANTATFNRQKLLDGSQDYATTITPGGTGVTHASIRQVHFGASNGLVINTRITQAASQGLLSAGAAGAFGAASSVGTNTVIQVTGPLGTTTVSLASNASNANVVSGINAVRDFTGVFGSGSDLFTEDYGSSAAISVTTIQGTYKGEIGTDKGQDIAGSINNHAATGNGLELSISTQPFSLSLDFAPGTGAGTGSFTIFESGFETRIGPGISAANLLTFGIEGATSSQLGRTESTISGESFFGFLSSLQGGSTNDLTSNPGNALRITRDAQDQVNSLRSFLGSIDSRQIQPQIDAMVGTIAELTSARSTIEDADFAAEAVNLTQAQILATAGSSVLAQVGGLQADQVGILLGFGT